MQVANQKLFADAQEASRAENQELLVESRKVVIKGGKNPSSNYDKK